MLTLIVPGLIWTRQALADLTCDLPLPAFTTLLGRGRLTQRPALPTRPPILAEISGLAAPLPAAALRRLALREHPEEADWLCLDPVRLNFQERSLVVDDPQNLRLTAEEAAALAVALAPTFAALGRWRCWPRPAGTCACPPPHRHFTPCRGCRPRRRALAAGCRLRALAPGAQRSADGPACPPGESGTRSRRTAGGEFALALGRRPPAAPRTASRA
jgi:hypothetical protein